MNGQGEFRCRVCFGVIGVRRCVTYYHKGEVGRRGVGGGGGGERNGGGERGGCGFLGIRGVVF